MSSSSDSEEFFDAQEDTCDENAFSGEKAINFDVAHRKEVDSLELQKEKLKQQQKELDIRRQKEDEALQRKLAELQMLETAKKEEQQEQNELLQRAHENESRRSKLDRMRDLIGSESTPNRSSPPPPSELTPGTLTARQLHSDLAGQGQNQSQVKERRTSKGPPLDGAETEKNHMLKRYIDDLQKSFESSDDIDGNVPCESTDTVSDSTDKTANTPTKEPVSHKKDEHEIKLEQPNSTQTATDNTQKLATATSPVIITETELKLHTSPENNDTLSPSNNTTNAPDTKSLLRNPADSKGTLPRRPSSSSVISNRTSRPTVSPPPPPTSRQSQGDAPAQEQDMPPPPYVPLERLKKSPSDDAKPVTKARTLDRPRPKSLGTALIPGNTEGRCLLTAPSPVVARKSLDMTSLMMGGNKVVTAAEEECNRAVDDVPVQEVGQGDGLAKSAGNSQPDTIRKGSMSPVLDHIDGTANFRDFKSHSFPRGLQPPHEHKEKDMLEVAQVLNLDTGQRVPLNEAEEKLPQGINPLSLHIMRRTQEYLSDPKLNEKSQDEVGEKKEEQSVTITTVKPVGKRRKKLRKLLGKAKQKIKTVKEEAKSHKLFHSAESSPSESDEEADEARRMIKIKASKSHSGPYDFDLLVPVQEINGAHYGAVWTMKWSHCGRLLASGGQDNLLRVWVLRDAFAYFDDMRQKYNEERKRRMSPAQSENSYESDTTSEVLSEMSSNISQATGEDVFSPFNRKPFCSYKGHSADILDISWSKNYFLLTSSMDKTVRLWHVSRKECLCCFQHIDFVTAIAFHPKDDRYFLSGSLDGKLRLWNIPEKKVAVWNEVSGSTKLITAANFCMNGKFAVVGTYDGRCVFYSTEQLKYYTQIHVRSTRGKNSKGRKVTGVEPFPGEDKILVTSNDSRIRLYDLRDLSLTCKYKGCTNNSSQIKASFSHDGRFLVCGSEDHFVYIWRTQHEFHTFSSARRDRSDYWESIKAHSAIVTVAMFSPKPNLVIKPQFEFVDSEDKQSTPEVRGEVLISADYNGGMKVFINKFKPGSG